jgi:hypothetical protein
LAFSPYLYIGWTRPVNIRKINSRKEDLKMNGVWEEKYFPEKKKSGNA